jgi:uncharacterized protein YraI
VNANLRLRTAPNTGGDILATVPAGSTLEVIGRNADTTWVQVNTNGQTGWMAVGYGTLNGDVSASPVTG